MRLGNLGAAVVFATGMIAAPAWAVSPSTCTPGKPTAESYTWNFKKEASGLLDQVKTDGMSIQRHAANLESYNGTNEIDWQLHADQLTATKAAVNDMGQKLCRLDLIRRRMF